MPGSVAWFNYAPKISRPSFACMAERHAFIRRRLYNELIRLVVANYETTTMVLVSFFTAEANNFQISKNFFNTGREVIKMADEQMVQLRRNLTEI